jgi:hypothetical protein
LIGDFGDIDSLHKAAHVFKTGGVGGGAPFAIKAIGAMKHACLSHSIADLALGKACDEAIIGVKRPLCAFSFTQEPKVSERGVAHIEGEGVVACLNIAGGGEHAVTLRVLGPK